MSAKLVRALVAVVHGVVRSRAVPHRRPLRGLRHPLRALRLAFVWFLPWRFVVVDDGIGLWFTFGRRRFLPKSETVVRAGLGSPVAFRGENRRFGYPLSDGFVERRRAALTEVLAFLGFRLASAVSPPEDLDRHHSTHGALETSEHERLTGPSRVGRLRRRVDPGSPLHRTALARSSRRRRTAQASWRREGVPGTTRQALARRDDEPQRSG